MSCGGGILNHMVEHSLVRSVAFAKEAARVYEAITTLDGLGGWWTPLVTGSPQEEGSDVRFEFEGLTQHIIMHVDVAQPAARPGARPGPRPGPRVEWTCRVHSALPEWAGTRVIWTLRPSGAAACELRLEHVGLTRALECYDHCEVGWEQFLASMVAYVERGVGRPYRASGGVCVTAKPAGASIRKA